MRPVIAAIVVAVLLAAGCGGPAAPTVLVDGSPVDGLLVDPGDVPIEQAVAAYGGDPVGRPVGSLHHVRFGGADGQELLDIRAALREDGHDAHLNAVVEPD